MKINPINLLGYKLEVEYDIGNNKNKGLEI